MPNSAEYRRSPSLWCGEYGEEEIRDHVETVHVVRQRDMHVVRHPIPAPHPLQTYLEIDPRVRDVLVLVKVRTVQ